MTGVRKRHSADFKAKVALEAIKEQSTVNEIASDNWVHPNQIGQWKKQAIEGLKDLFSIRKGRDTKELQERESALYEEIGKLKMELEWLKKKSGTLRT